VIPSALLDKLQGMDPSDGLQPYVRDVHGFRKLCVVFQASGKLVTHPAYNLPRTPALAMKAAPSGDDDDWVDIGRAARLELLLSAMCRFVNTGGCPRDIDRLAGSLECELPDSWRPELEGYGLLGTSLNNEGEYEHLFAPHDGSYEGIRWVEGRFIEPVDLQDVLADIRKAEDAERDALEVDLLGEADPGAEKEVPGDAAG
jgi:hypothetical protein